ncbi:hypothetical protein FRC08_000329 [Ceratobasidium sp. 394]|nr:hypothetical protein FRC08_000329 [Ceratobasidium sp. 394]
MFPVQWGNTGEAGMRAGIFVPDKSLKLYNETKPVEIPAGCYPELGRTPPCELREGSKGRGIWVRPGLSKELIPNAGARMICATPHVTALSTQYLGDHCSSCHEEEQAGRPLKRCQRCRTILYCDQTCQKFDWPLHKLECPALVAHAERHAAGTEPGKIDKTEDTQDTVPVPSETIRALGRLLWLQSREKPGSGKRKEFELMQSHREKLTASSPQTASYTRLGHALAAYVSHGEPSPEKLSALGIGSAKDIVDLLSKFSTNAHTLSTPSLTPIGVALSPVAALINHSCVPNCVIVFPRGSATRKLPNQLEVIAFRSMNPGEELTASYVDMALPAEHRQTILRERYMFECACPHCQLTKAKLSDFVDGRRALRCANRNCQGFLPLPELDNPKLLTAEKKCLQCRSVCTIQPPAIADAIRVGEEGLEKAEALQFDNPEHAFKLTSNLIPLLSRFFHVGAHPLLGLARLHLSLLISQLELNPHILDETIRAAARVSAGVTAIYPPGHPTRGIAYAELGKLLAADEYVPPGGKPLEATPSQLDPKANVVWVAGDDDDVVRGFERLRMAHQSLMSSREELLLGFGYVNDGGAVGREVTELAKQLEREVAIWRRAGGGKRPNSGTKS